MGNLHCNVDGGDVDGDGNNDNVGGMTGMAVLSQTEGVGGEDNNGCGVSRTFFKTFSLRLFFTQFLWLTHFNLFMVPQRQGRGSIKEFNSEFVRVLSDQSHLKTFRSSTNI